MFELEEVIRKKNEYSEKRRAEGRNYEKKANSWNGEKEISRRQCRFKKFIRRSSNRGVKIFSSQVQNQIKIVNELNI